MREEIRCRVDLTRRIPAAWILLDIARPLVLGRRLGV